MNNTLNPQDALNALYSVARKMNLSADDHEYLANCYLIVKEEITPKPEEKPETKK